MHTDRTNQTKATGKEIQETKRPTAENHQKEEGKTLRPNRKGTKKARKTGLGPSNC